MARIIIAGIGSISPLGADGASAAEAYRRGEPRLALRDFRAGSAWCGALPPDAEARLAALAAERPVYAELDRSVLMAIHAARLAVRSAGWNPDAETAVNIGSSRGATGLWEELHAAFAERGSVPAHAAPATTLGNLSSWIAQDLKLAGAAFSHSVTCSTALHAVANGCAWLRSGMAKRFLAGGSEAPLTPFTQAQFAALRVAARGRSGESPCRPLGEKAASTVVLGEGAAVLALESRDDCRVAAGSVEIESLGWAQESIDTHTSISEEGAALAAALAMAAAAAGHPRIDAVIAHAPGSRRGDRAEIAAIEALFPRERPLILSNKWLIGHTLGASGALSIEYALHLLAGAPPPVFPYPLSFAQPAPRPLERLLVNATGFGGNAVSVLLHRVEPPRA